MNAERPLASIYDTSSGVPEASSVAITATSDCGAVIRCRSTLNCVMMPLCACGYPHCRLTRVLALNGSAVTTGAP